MPDSVQMIGPSGDRVEVSAAMRSHWAAHGYAEDQPPTESDNKPVWVDYARRHGVDTDGLTKQQIIDTVT